jgi:hypothetical protein
MTMSLILCHLSLEVVIECESKTMGELGQLAKRFAEEEIRNGSDSLQCGRCELVTAVEQLPLSWRSSRPYRSPDIGPELTCRQILEGKS